MGYLKQLDVENFKSWRGKQTIGPFMRFNCIIGTNGSGKSNVMDAMGFVMGERVSSLRVKHTKDLIHGAHIGKPVSATASVTMRFCDDNDDEIVFSRTISGESSEYRVNGRQITLAKYTGELEKIGIVVKARNCLVFQRTKMFERISNSLELAKEYDTKLAALQKAKEDTQFHFNRKRAAAAEKKQVFKDKTEAEKYQTLLDELGESKLQLSLFQLYHNEKGIEARSESLREKQEEVAATKSAMGVWEQAVKARKKEHGRLTRELQKLEKEIRSLFSVYIKAKVNTAHHQRKAEEARASLQKSQKQQAKKEQDLQELERELAELEKAWRTYEREMEEQGAQRGAGVQLDEAQLERYKELKELARKKGAVFVQKAEKLRWEVKADREKLEFDKRRKSEVEANIKHSQTQLDDLNKRAGKLEEYANTSKYLREQEERLVEELERGRVRMQELNEELVNVLGELQNARVDSQENRRQQRRDEVLESLCRLYPDVVYGRLVDLCQPIHKKYQLAVTKVFGKYMNAIVVSSVKVARDCIKFVKEERAEPETFLPIDYLDVNPLNERLREMRGAKMVVDVVQCSQNAPQLKRVVQFVCGNALVCETLKDARNIAFGGPERFKTVALDGTMFSRSGVISGGSVHLRSKARRWEEKEMSGLKERKEQLTAELRELMKMRRKDAELKQVRAQVQGIQTRLKYTNSELETIRKKSIPACHAEISRLASELSNLESHIEIELVKQQKELISAETALEQQRLHKHNLLLACKIESLPLTLLSGTLDEISDLDSESQTTCTLDIYEREAHVVFDYGPLGDELKVRLSMHSQTDIGRPKLNLSYSNVFLCVSAFEASTSVAKKCHREFEQVKAKRFSLFSQCFEHVSVAINQIYKQLCRNDSAQAILSAENPDEPYLDGISYNCVAPGKRFMAMDNLSGGEKSIAALAVVFAIHSFRPAPFFVLDEVDAALDNTNIGKVTSFIREQSRENFQIIVISLKEEFYSRSDALLGVYSEFNECMFSRLLSLDLTPYPLNEENGNERKSCDGETGKEAK
uniref:SMC hinge domain-containing protein n=1 Tax=Pygocentrus nattereri TaxID=42514 RepID=A0AAR2LBG2_PYGNA